MGSTPGTMAGMSRAHDSYLARAAAAGVSAEIADAELEAARAELLAYGGDPAEAIAVAWHRLTEGGPDHRPADEVRSAVRAAIPGAHPELVDQVARHFAPDQTLAAEMRRRQS